MRATTPLARVLAAADATPKTTWTKTHDQSNCADWNDKMNDEERSAAATALLSDKRKDSGSQDAPPADLVTQFGTSVSALCTEGPTTRLTEAAALVYISENDTFAP